MKKYIAPKIETLSINAQTILSSSGTSSDNNDAGFGDGQIGSMEAKSSANFDF